MSRFGLRTRPGVQVGDVLAAPPAWVPTDIAGLRLWLDAADTGTIESNVGAVSHWVSKDPNYRRFAQANTSLQPTTGASTQNGRNVIDLAGDYLVSASASSVWKFMHDGTKYAVFALAAFGNTANPDDLYGLMGTSGTATSDVGVSIRYDDRSSASRNDNGSTVMQALTVRPISTAYVNDVLPAQQHVIQSIVFDPANATAADRFKIRFNAGTWYASNPETGTPNTGDPTTTLAIGAIAASGANAMSGEIAEIIVYEAELTTIQIAQIESYLAAKWGLTLA